jgi:hypothetical protein
MNRNNIIYIPIYYYLFLRCLSSQCLSRPPLDLIILELEEKLNLPSEFKEKVYIQSDIIII